MVIAAADDDELTSRPRCLFCGEAERIEIWEIWSDHNFALDTCCAPLLEHVSAGMHDDPQRGRDLLRRLGAETLTGYRLRRVTDGEGSHLMLDWQLRIAPVRFAVARAFIARHHAHRPPPVTWRWGSSVWNGPTMLGVTVGNPVARAYMHRGIVEVNRLCIRRDVPPLLRWNGASMLYAQASRDAERRGFRRIVTYTREDEDGTRHVAAGWTCEGPAGGHSWISAARPNRSAAGWVPKLRWSRSLRPRTPATARAQRPTPSQAEPLWIGEWEAA